MVSRYSETGAFPYRGYTQRTGMDSIFLIRKARDRRCWVAYGLIDQRPVGSFLEARTLRELGAQLETMR